MKKRFRDSALNDLFARLQSEDFDQREHALFQLALMLRRSNADGAGRVHFEFDGGGLPRDLQRIRLGWGDQQSIVERLSLVIASRPESRATALWTLGEAAAAVGWAPTADLLKVCGGELDAEAAYQACRALRGWLATSEPGLIKPEADLAGLVRLASGWAAAGDRRLAGEARTLFELLRSKP